MQLRMPALGDKPQAIAPERAKRRPSFSQPMERAATCLFRQPFSAPLELHHVPAFTQGLRPGLHSAAAPRLVLPSRRLFASCKNIVNTGLEALDIKLVVVSLRCILRHALGVHGAQAMRMEGSRGPVFQSGEVMPRFDVADSGRPMERILVVEDDRAVQKALRRLFEAEGFAVEISADGKSALAAYHSATPAAVVLDLRLPAMSGRDVCREIKQQAPALPIIVLSAASDVSDKVLLLELGADDYVTKPFSPRELLARVRAALRRSSRSASAEVSGFDGILVDFIKMEVTRDGQPIGLTAQEFKTLKFLMQNAERVISRDELLNEVWGYQNYPSTRTVDNHILKLRQKLEKDPANPVHFRTVHGMGYKFVR